MSAVKAEEIMRLALMLAGRRTGVTLADVRDEFNWQLRTTQRKLRAVEEVFPAVETFVDDEGHKRWRLEGHHLRELMSISADELAAFDLAIAHLARDGLTVEATELRSLRDKVTSLVPRMKVARLMTDQEALLEAQGFVARPGPRPRVDDRVVEKVVQAIKECKFIEFSYQSQTDAEPTIRRVAPYGFLSGLRRYLVGGSPAGSNTLPKTYRLDNIAEVTVADEYFVRPDGFDLQAFANRAFGVFQNDEEFGEVIWKFAPCAAAKVRGHVFHPTQTLEEMADGSVIVRFHAAGHLEMCWYLYAWGDNVEVLAPAALRKMTEEHRRSDFPATP